MVMPMIEFEFGLEQELLEGIAPPPTVERLMADHFQCLRFSLQRDDHHFKREEHSYNDALC